MIFLLTKAKKQPFARRAVLYFFDISIFVDSVFGGTTACEKPLLRSRFCF